MQETTATILLLPFLILLPLLVIRLEKKSRIVRWASPIIISYLVGILMGNIPGLSFDQKVLETIASLSVILAIPLLLFSANFSRMLKQVRPALLAFTSGVLAVIICSAAAFFIFKGSMAEPAAASGMMMGVYTGGTFNMSAIGIALQVEEETFILLNSADIIFSGIYFVFLLTIGKAILGGLLPRYKNNGEKQGEEKSESRLQDKRSGSFRQISLGVLLSLLVSALSFAFSFLVKGELSEPLIILGITTLAIAASFHKGIRKLPHTFYSANYLLLVFALAMGSMANFSELLAASSSLFYFCGFVVFGSVLLHYLFACVFGIDRDTAIIASTAAIFGPAFIGPVARGIGNKEIIAMGITLGLIGYAIGNYLGLGLAYLLNQLP